VVLSAEAAASPPVVGRLSQRAGRLQLREPAATVTAALGVAEHAGDAGAVLRAGSPLGLVSVREDTCTLCGACADACPTGALAHAETAEASVLSFDAALCIACDRCVPVCPEGASATIRTSRATDLAAVARGPIELKRDEVALCRNCGRPVAPRAMLERIRRTLETEEQADPLLGLLTELCSDCRGLAT
jgi:ferredoxin